MIAAWMLYAIAVGAALAAAAWVADAACRLLRRPRRGVWALALAATVCAPLAAATLGTRRPAASGTAAAAGLVLGGAAHVPRGAAPAPAVRAPRASWPTITIGPSHPLRALDRPLVALWVAAAGAGFALLAAATRRLARARRRWRSLGIGSDVLVAEAFGPAVAGVRRPVIVVPRWALALAPDDLALVLAHERAHLDARDPLLLAAGVAALVALPWLLPLWFVVSRLRLAVESDCDRRVLRRHPDAVRYGRLLLDVAERALPNAPRWMPDVAGAPALLQPRRLVETRLHGLLTPAPGRRARARATLQLAAAAGAATLACMAPRPQRGGADAPRTQRATIDSLRTAVASLTAQLDSARRSPRAETRAEPRAAARGTPSPARVARPADDSAPSPVGAALSSLPDPPRIVEPTLAELREAVARAAPDALTGAMGHRPYVWLVLDSAGRVARSATGGEGLLTVREIVARAPAVRGAFADQPDSARVLDAEGVDRTFPSLRGVQLHSFGWTGVAAGADTVNVLWVRPTSLGWRVDDARRTPDR